MVSWKLSLGLALVAPAFLVSLVPVAEASCTGIAPPVWSDCIGYDGNCIGSGDNASCIGVSLRPLCVGYVFYPTGSCLGAPP